VRSHKYDVDEEGGRHSEPRVRWRVRHDGCDGEEADTGQVFDGKYNGKQDMMSMLTRFVILLVQLLECQKKQEDTQYVE
jgi:hypothetical protein